MLTETYSKFSATNGILVPLMAIPTKLSVSRYEMNG